MVAAKTIAQGTKPGRKPRAWRAWLHSDEEEFRAMYGWLPLEALEEYFDRTPNALKEKSYVMGLHRERPYFLRWSDAEEQELRDLWANHSRSSLVRHFGISPGALFHKAECLGLPRAEKRPWTPADVAYFRKHYAAIPVQELALQLNRSPAALIHRAIRLGISRKRSIDLPPELRELIALQREVERKISEREESSGVA